ncbi:MAG: hypothetical protein AB7T74_16585 [Clostridia bacterium]
MKPQRCTGLFRAFFVAALLAITCTLAFGQYMEASVQLPAAAVPGQVFYIRVLMKGAEAIRTEAVEPLYEGPVQYIGADVRPIAQAEGPAAYVDYHFLALREGSLVISALSVLYDGSPIQLGSWHVAIGVDVDDEGGETGRAAGTGKQADGSARIASWVAPGVVRAYEPFLARAVLPDGNPVVVPSLAIPGAITRLSGGGPGWTIIGTKAGELTLPALDLDTTGGRILVSAAQVRIQSLPQDAAGTRAVGTWSVSLTVDVAGGEAHTGDTASWEATAHGKGSAGFAEPPTVRVTGPDGRQVALLADPFRFGQALPGEATFTGHIGAIGTFVMELPGEYRVELEPYPWFDPVSSRQRYARVAPVVIRAIQPEVAAWVPAADLKVLAVATIRRLAASRGGQWAQALIAIEGDDPEGVRLAYEQLSAARPAPPDERLPWKWLGPGGLDEGLAALAFLGTDPVKAFHEAARLERWSLLPGEARIFADAAATALAIQDRPATVLPPPVALGSAALLMILVALLALLGPFRLVSLVRLTGFMVIGLAMLFSVALTLSVIERMEVYFVSCGGSAMAVPSEAATISFEVGPGATGKVLRRIPSWVFVEFGDGRNAWIRESGICLY